MENQHHIDWKKYVIAFFITASIFGTVIYISDHFNNKRIEDIRLIQDSISTNIMSLETQVSLLAELDCEDIGSSILSSELNSLAAKIDYSEKNIGQNDIEVQQLKKFYSLLEIKDYQLMKRLATRCNKQFVFALYFYSNDGTCTNCQEASYILTYLREKYPELRVYSFDYNLDLSAIKTLISISKIKDDLPAIVIDGKTITWPQDRDSLEAIVKAKYPKGALIATSTESVRR